MDLIFTQKNIDELKNLSQKGTEPVNAVKLGFVAGAMLCSRTETLHSADEIEQTARFIVLGLEDFDPEQKIEIISGFLRSLNVSNVQKTEELRKFKEILS